MKRSLLVVLSSAFCYILFSSYTNGTANVAGINATGSFGSQASCDGGNCHGPKDVNMVVDITIKDMLGNEVVNSRYTPDAYYKVYISGYASGNFPIYSYQFSATRAQGFNLNGGTFVSGSGLHSTVAGGAIVAEPLNPKSTSSVGVNNTFRDSFFWQAPPPNSGEWKLFATALLGNDDGAKSGDKSANYQRSYFPNPVSVEGLDENIVAKIFPNPAKDQLNLELKSTERGTYSATVYNSHGQMIYNQQLHIDVTNYRGAINTSSFVPGTYFLEIKKDGKKRVIPFSKS